MTLHERDFHEPIIASDLPAPVSSIIAAVPLLSSLLEGGSTPTLSAPTLSTSPAIPLSAPTPAPSPSPITTPPLPTPTSPSTPPPVQPTRSTLSTPLPLPPSTFSPPPSTLHSSLAPVQSPKSTGGSPSPSTDSHSRSRDSSTSHSRGSSLSSARPPSGSSTSSDTRGSDGGVHSSHSSIKNRPSPSTNGFVSSDDSIASTRGDRLTSQITNVATGSSSLPDTTSTQTPVFLPGPLSPSTTHIKKVATYSSSFLHPTSTQSTVIISAPFPINNPSSTNDPNVASSNSASSVLANPHHQLSTGQIIAIIFSPLILLIILPIVLFILRRRSQIHRADRSTKWWFATTRSSQLYGDGTTENLIEPGTQTARSSFGTTVDHSDPIPSAYVIPPFPPPTAEMGRSNISRPVLVINLEGKTNNTLGENRHSLGSVNSDHSQYLVVSHRNSSDLDEQTSTPMSVRPFSPSESFAFPKPPEPAAVGSSTGSVAGTSSRPMSNATSLTLPTPPLPPGLSSPSFVPLVKSSTTKSLSSTTNPSEDSFSPSKDVSPYSDIPVQLIRRPFQPTLSDELSVILGDGVRVLHTFDDGWGLIEKVRTDGREEERGLIPMSCLRSEGEELVSQSESSSLYEGPRAF